MIMKIYEEFLSIGKAAQFLGVAVVTVRRWAISGQLAVHHRTIGYHRRFSVIQLSELRGEPHEKRISVGYARVSSHDQKADLVRQADRLTQCGAELIIDDLGSGLNCKKRGLRKLLSLLLNKQVSTLYLTHKDRLLRFGHELVFQLCSWAGTAVIIQDEEQSVTFEQALCKDVLTLMTVFSARLYGKRSHQNKAI
jgi:putative resolvase